MICADGWALLELHSSGSLSGRSLSIWMFNAVFCSSANKKTWPLMSKPFGHALIHQMAKSIIMSTAVFWVGNWILRWPAIKFKSRLNIIELWTCAQCAVVFFSLKDQIEEQQDDFTCQTSTKINHRGSLLCRKVTFLSPVFCLVNNIRIM